MPASPHIAARTEQLQINLNHIINQQPQTSNSKLVIEGAGGILVPLNDQEFIIDLIEQLQAKAILVSRNYLGSINHSLLTAAICKQRNIDVLGWIFNDTYLDYEDEIVQWTGYPKIASIPFAKCINKTFILQQANEIRLSLQQLIYDKASTQKNI
jgi:dethiobiotin synthetase